MNFFDGTLSEVENEKGKFSSKNLAKGGIRLVSEEKTKGSSIRLGIRPQHLKLDKKGDIQGTVTMIERLGTETVVELATSENIPFRFVSSGSVDLSVGEQAHFDFDPEMAHLFPKKR